jgi:hypothetical protein
LAGSSSTFRRSGRSNHCWSSRPARSGGALLSPCWRSSQPQAPTSTIAFRAETSGTWRLPAPARYGQSDRCGPARWGARGRMWRSTDDRTRTAPYGGVIDAVNPMPLDNRTRSQPDGAPGDVAQTHAAAFHPWQRSRRRARQQEPLVAEDVEHEVRELLYGWRSGHLQVAQSDHVAPGEISHRPAGRSSARPRMRG